VKNVVNVQDQPALAELCERVRRSSRVAIDTEFHSERTYVPSLMMMQLAFDDGAAIVDPIAVRDLRPLIEALSDVIVVGHALSSDLKIFAERFDIVPPSVFDCQIAASFLGYGMQVSLAQLVADLEGVRLAKSQTVSDWSKRPLTQIQIEYLVDDVTHLLPMYDKLTQRLEETGRLTWALEECALLGELDRYRADERRAYLRIPGATRMNRRELGVLSEIVKMREQIARERDVPARYVLPDDVLAGLATMRPKRVEELEQLRRIDAATRRQLGVAILDAVARGEAMPDDELPQRPERPLGQTRDTLVALMGVLVGEIARENDLPSSLLVARSTLERVAREMPSDPQHFRSVLGLSHWRLALVEEPLWRLLSGELHLQIEGYTQGDPKIRLSS
jgi:ribonuclease D